jgi:hypothetical protein
MARIVASLLMCILFVQGFTQTLELRHCSDNLVSVELNGVKRLCTCDEAIVETKTPNVDDLRQRKCCDSETLSVASSEFQSSTTESQKDFVAEMADLNAIYPISTWSAANNTEAVFYTDSSPPRKRKLAAFIFNGQFRSFLG